MFLNWESPSSLIGAQLVCVDWSSSFLLGSRNRVYSGSNNHSLSSLTCLTQWIECSHCQSKLIGLLFSNHLNNGH